MKFQSELCHVPSLFYCFWPFGNFGMAILASASSLQNFHFYHARLFWKNGTFMFFVGLKYSASVYFATNTCFSIISYLSIQRPPLVLQKKRIFKFWEAPVHCFERNTCSENNWETPKTPTVESSESFLRTLTAQKWKLSIKDFFSKCDQFLGQVYWRNAKWKTWVFQRAF